MAVARRWLTPAVALLLAPACRDAEPPPSRWPMSRAEGPLALRVRHPLAGDPPPASGRDYVMGATGNGRAMVTVNGERVAVAPNGSFLAYVRVPRAGTSHVIEATLDGEHARVEVPVGTSPPVAPALAAPPPASGGVVTVAPGTELGLPSEIAAREAPEGDYRWQLLPGTRGEVVEASGHARRVRFPGGAGMWLDAALLRPARGPSSRAPSAAVRLASATGETDVAVQASEPLAYDVEETARGLAFTVYGAAVRPVALAGRGYVAGVTGRTRDGTARLEVTLRGPVFGYEVRWRDGAMVLRVRQPPAIDAVRPLAGLVIVVDAGHPPGGAVGPTGLAEPVVTLDVARRLETLLRQRGARVLLTRTDTVAVSLDRRVALARAAGAHAFVSIHADAIHSGADPFRDIGTATYASRAHAMPLADAVRLALGERLGLPDRGVHQGDYAVVRSTWFPAILTEGATLTVPAQEAALADPAFREAYAAGIADGIEVYFRRLRR